MGTEGEDRGGRRVDTRVGVAALSAGSFYLIGGVITLINAQRSAHESHVHPDVVRLVGVAAVLAGLVAFALPWARWKPRSTLWLAGLAVVLIGAGEPLT